MASSSCRRGLACILLVVQERLEGQGGAVPVGLEDVAVAVEGEGGAAVAEPVGDALGVLALGDQQGRVEVPEGVQRDLRDPGLLAQVVERAEQVAGVERRADLGAEDEVVIFPAGAAGRSLSGLPRLVGGQDGEGFVVEGDEALAVVRLGGGEGGLVSDEHEGLLDADAVLLDVAPPEAEHLPAAEAGGDEEVERGVEAVGTGSVEERAASSDTSVGVQRRVLAGRSGMGSMASTGFLLNTSQRTACLRALNSCLRHLLAVETWPLSTIEVIIFWTSIGVRSSSRMSPRWGMMWRSIWWR